MPKYAYFDHTAAPPQRVMGWFDTDVVTYPTMPDDADLVELTDEEWAGRLAGFWTIVPGVGNGVLTSAEEAPPPTVPPTIDEVLAAKIADGIVITSLNDPDNLNCTMALDAQTMNEIGTVVLGVRSGMGFPGDLPVFVYPDLDGVPRTFNEDRIVALFRAQRDLLFALNTQAAIDRHGGTAAWPEQIGTIP